MTTGRDVRVRPMWRRAAIAVGCAAGVALVAARGGAHGQTRPAAPEPPVPALSPYIDAHTHFDEKDPEGSVAAAVAAAKTANAARILFQAPPDTFDHEGHFDAEVILAAARRQPDRIGVLGGGGSLNAMIQQEAASRDVGADLRKRFTERAEALLREGVVGFGEMTAEHFAGATPYQYAPADHPLFLLLADIAARAGVPIVIHMEAVPEAMPLPANLKSPPNAPELHDNITALGRLLAHNRRAQIVWAHAGSDGTGFRTPDVCRRMLVAHPNLAIELKLDPLSHGRNYPVNDDGRIKPEWLKLLQDFSDRFIVGTDQHYPEPAGQPQRWQAVVLLLNQLPEDVRRKIGTENARRIYTANPSR